MWYKNSIELHRISYDFTYLFSFLASCEWWSCHPLASPESLFGLSCNSLEKSQNRSGRMLEQERGQKVVCIANAACKPIITSWLCGEITQWRRTEDWFLVNWCCCSWSLSPGCVKNPLAWNYRVAFIQTPLRRIFFNFFKIILISFCVKSNRETSLQRPQNCLSLFFSSLPWLPEAQAFSFVLILQWEAIGHGRDDEKSITSWMFSRGHWWRKKHFRHYRLVWIWTAEWEGGRASVPSPPT